MQWKQFCKVSSVTAKTLKTLKYLQKFLLTMDIWIFVYYPVSVFYLKVDMQVLLLSEIVLAKVKISMESIDG